MRQVVVVAVALSIPVVVQEPAPACKIRGSREWLSQRPSPFDSATVTIGGKTAKVCYSRPSARGRVVFGGLVEFGTAWRTGANEATVLHVPFPAEVAGISVDAGQYMLFTAPRPEQWGVVLYRSDTDDPIEMFRTMHQVGYGMARVEALADHVEQFTIRGVDGTTQGELVLEWERVRVRIPIRPID